MTELTRGEKIRLTMIKNIMQQNPGSRWTYGAATEMRKDGIALAY